LVEENQPPSQHYQRRDWKRRLAPKQAAAMTLTRLHLARRDVTCAGIGSGGERRRDPCAKSL
jgi:hypothetical protein